ncbi:MAG: dTDP-4-dehydrorhamnose 3,5-epimerase [Rhizobiales bacterium]|nr:dTDP-4-dehydrorhamnose 3,5-epimerase [Hyphomicrobiales bacterium]
MPEFRPLGLEGAFEILPDKFGDERGFFSETYNARIFAENGITTEFVQDNHSFSSARGVLRGLHFQTPPFAQAKLVRVTRGRVYDVLVDLRQSSPTFKKWVGIEVSAEKWNQVLVPAGFAHGFVTLEENTEFLYKVSAFYARDCDRSVRYDDPEIGIEWPVAREAITLSDKDRNAPLLAAVETGFTDKG